MLVAEFESNRIDALIAQKGPTYCCPECKKEVVLKKGRKVIHHFAHKPPTNCHYAKGESRAHMVSKYTVYDALRSRDIRAEIEYTVDTMPGDRRADVMAWSPNGARVAFEMQHSPIDVAAIELRAKSYARAGIAQIWVPFIPSSVWTDGRYASEGWSVERYSPRSFERWVHGFNGKHGMWMFDPNKKEFWLARFRAHKIYVEAAEWYDESGDEQYAGGYSRYSKRYKELSLTGPYKAEELLIDIYTRKEYSVADYYWPAGRVATLKPIIES